MSDLIDRQKAIDAVRDGMCTFYDCDVVEKIEALPSAEPKELGEIIEKISDTYKKAVSLTYINNPIAWALYQVWKEYDRG